MKRNYLRGVKRTVRRLSVIDRLREQLELGTKVLKGKPWELIPLTDKDKGRIKKEIKTLKERVR